MNGHHKIPHVSTFRFLKNALNILKDPLPFHHQNFTEKGDVFKLNIGYKLPIIFCRNAALAEYVLQKNHRNYTKSKIQTRDLTKYVGHGLLTSEGAAWKKQRQLIQPAFHKKQLSTLVDTMLLAIRAEYQAIEVGKKTEVFPIFNDLAFQTVVKSLFSSAATSEEIKRLQYITEAAQNMMVRELRQPYLGWWFRASGLIKKHLDLTNEARQTLKGLVDDRRQSDQNHGDLLDMLLDARDEQGNAMDEDQLIDEILILFTAGHETTSNALTFACQLLALHPEWQEKIYEETLSNVHHGDDLMSFITASKACRQVIEETMRLYPPAYFIDRVNVEDDHFDGMDFKKGSSLLLSIYEIHRHPALWDHPEEFHPERFGDAGKTYTSQYFPFGAGPRKCIGHHFAMFEMILAITELVKNYTLHPEFETIEIRPLITLKPKNAYLKFEARQS